MIRRKNYMSQFKFSVGPWNVHEGADAFGPEVRKTIPFEKKVEKFKEIGFDAVQFHDDDAVPDINHLSEEQIKKEAKEVKGLLDKNGLAAEFVAPRLWMDPRTIDGGFTSNSKDDREFAMWRAYRSIDIAKELGCDKIVLWLAREGTLCYESKNPVEGVKRIIEAIDKMLGYDSSIKVLIETKPNEPIDRSFCPTMGHAMAISAASKDPSRVGGLLETAHAILAGLDPASEIAFALAMGKLWSVHLNDQNSIKYDQDKAFGVENLRQAFNQVKVLVENDYGKNGEYIGLDVKAMRTQKDEVCYAHLENSLKIAKMLEKKVKKFDYVLQEKYVEERNYETLEMYVIELLLEG
jgi:xylose isomerase